MTRVVIAAIAVAVTLAGCSAIGNLSGPADDSSGGPTVAEPTLTSPPATATSLPPVDAGAAFGPDGTHYPTDTPDIRAGLGDYHVVDVEASATAIRDALDALTPEQVDAGSVIRVAPGDIPNMRALDGYSNPRQQKVLITARDGFESVTGTLGWRFTDVRGIAVTRVDLAELDVKGATHCSFGWLRLSNHYLGAAAANGVAIDDVQFVEVVEPDAVLKSSDSAQVKAYPPNSLQNVTIDGSYLAPSFYQDGSYGPGNPRPHTDTLQIEGDGITGGIIISDTAVFASNNSAIIIGGVTGITFEHALVVAGGVQQQRYPFPAGAAGARGARQGPGSVGAVQGKGGGSISAIDSTFIGSLRPVWATVTNSTTNVPSAVKRDDRFTLDESLSSWTEQDLDAVSVPPTADYLRTIWD